jgi:hypothetical protein
MHAREIRMGTMGPGRGERGAWWGSGVAQAAAEVLVKAGLEALIASGVLATLFVGSLAVVMRDPPVVLGSAAVLSAVLFLTSVVHIALLRGRHRRVLEEHDAMPPASTRLADLETLVQHLRAVDLEMTALRCHGRTDPEQSPDEARRDCVRVVLRPVYNQLLASGRQVSVAFHEWDETHQHFRHVVATPEFRPADRDVVAHLDKDSAAGRALAVGEPNIVPDVLAPEARLRGWKRLPTQRTIGSSLQVPVYRIGGRSGGEWLGVVSADCEEVNAFTHADGDLLLEFAVKLNVIYEGMFDPDEAVDGPAGAS